MAVPKEDMLYDGDDVDWYGVSKYNATSGQSGHQTASEQTISNTGPIPEGTYSFSLTAAGTARVVNVAAAQLDTRQGIESLVDMPGPDGQLYQSAEWGKNRVRLNALMLPIRRPGIAAGFICTIPPRATRTAASKWNPGSSPACASTPKTRQRRSGAGNG